MTVVNFTGKHKTATPLDRKMVADWLRKLADEVEAGEVIGVAYAGLRAEPEGTIVWDWYTLPPSNRFTLIGAIHGLLADYSERVYENPQISESDT